MITKTSRSETPQGARFTLLLIPLFAAVAFAMLGLLYPELIGDALETHSNTAPLANPTLIISSETGEALYLDEQTLSDLSEIGTVTPAVRYDTETADGIRIRLLAVDSTAAEDAFVLTDGRMPQNDTECVVVSLDPVPSVSLLCKEIGSAIRPCGKNGDVLTDSQSGMPCSLTVVGIGESILSALAPITNDTAQLLVYTASDRSWQNPDTTSVLYLTDCKADDSHAAVQSIYTSTADVRSSYRAAHANERLQSCTIAAESADSAVITHEITVQAIENRLATADLRVSEAEANMMDAVAALQAEQQEFVSDMEYNEYYALRQVDLIPRRDRAEEGYAKQEEVIAQMNADLHTAYADRDAIRIELQHAVALLSVLQAEADAAHSELNEQQKRSASSEQPQTWSISGADRHPGYTVLQTHAATVRKTVLLLCAVAISIYLVGTITVYAASRRVTCSLSRALFSSVLAAIPAIPIGGILAARPIFTYCYPALRDALVLPMFTEDILTAGAAVLLITAVISIGIAAVGRRMQHIQQTHTKT